MSWHEENHIPIIRGGLRKRINEGGERLVGRATVGGDIVCRIRRRIAHEEDVSRMDIRNAHVATGSRMPDSSSAFTEA